MRSLIGLCVVLVLPTGFVFAQTNVKQRISGNLNNAVEQHNEDLQRAMNGEDNNNSQNSQGQPQPPRPQAAQKPAPDAPAQTATVDGVTAGWITRTAKDGKTKVRLYFAYPQTLSKENPVPALVVLQEWWGMNDDMQQRTREFAKHGYYAVAPGPVQRGSDGRPAEGREAEGGHEESDGHGGYAHGA